MADNSAYSIANGLTALVADQWKGVTSDVDDMPPCADFIYSDENEDRFRVTVHRLPRIEN